MIEYLTTPISIKPITIIIFLIIDLIITIWSDRK